jgi:hypothetical protein
MSSCADTKNNSIARCPCHGIDWYQHSRHYILMKELLNDTARDIMIYLVKLTTSYVPTTIWICNYHDDTWKTTGHGGSVYHCGQTDKCERIRLGCINNPDPFQLCRAMSVYSHHMRYVYDGDNCYDESGKPIRQITN